MITKSPLNIVLAGLILILTSMTARAVPGNITADPTANSSQQIVVSQGTTVTFTINNGVDAVLSCTGTFDNTGGAYDGSISGSKAVTFGDDAAGKVSTCSITISTQSAGGAPCTPSKTITFYVIVPQITSTTVATASTADDDRTTIGIGEQVNLTIAPSTLGSVTWSIKSPSTEGTIDQFYSATTKLSSGFTPYSTVISATTDSGIEADISFDVIPPSSGLVVQFNSDNPTSGGDWPLASPGNKVGQDSFIDIEVSPTNVSFSNVDFQENISTQTWTWPDGSTGTKMGTTVSWSVDDANTSTDHVAAGLFSKGVLVSGGAPHSFNYAISVPEQYTDDSGTWQTFDSTETHKRYWTTGYQAYGGIVDGSSSAYGSAMGPYQ